jgi:hypothetical protein
MLGDEYDEEIGRACITLIMDLLWQVANTGEMDAWHASRNALTDKDGLEELIDDLFQLWAKYDRPELSDS